MISKTIIAAVTALALTPALAFAAPTTPAMKPVPAMSKQMKADKVVVTKHHRPMVKTQKATKLPTKAKAKNI
jgi:hypothetical protein